MARRLQGGNEQSTDSGFQLISELINEPDS